MKNWFKGLLAETDGCKNPSMTRFLSLICVVMACFIALIAVYKDRNLDSAAILCSVFLGSGLGAKVLQKRSEILSQTSQFETIPEKDK